ncbi:MAG TPA: hypothetical protein VLF93_03495 [Candidatus Saccharimonadales bacterium]|nr:hypothetical protein [Candidatus Saccharimonadales bacterium]
MKRVFSQHKIIILSILTALIYVILFIPVIKTITPLNLNSVSPCINPDPVQFKYLCNLEVSITLPEFFQEHSKINTINFPLFLAYWIGLSGIFYSGSILSLSVLNHYKTKNKLAHMVIKILLLGLLLLIALCVTLLPSFFGF